MTAFALLTTLLAFALGVLLGRLRGYREARRDWERALAPAGVRVHYGRAK